MPPTRRRPVPTTPQTGRPRVAGLRKRDNPTITQPPTPQPATAEETDTPPPTRHADAAHPATPPLTAHPDTSPLTTHPDTSPLTTHPDEAPHLTDPDASPLHDDQDTHRSTTEQTTAEPDASPFVEDVADSTEEPPTPRPTPKRKRSTRHSTTLTSTNTRTRTEREPTKPKLLLPITLVVVAAVLVGVGVWLQAQAGNARYNRALVDSAGTTEASGQVREAVEKAFSYNFADVAATEKAANELLVGKAKCQYNAIFGPVKSLAPEQKLVVTVKAVSSGVTSLEDNRATVLLFLDQVTTRTTDNQSGGGIAMMRAGAQKADGRWKVDNMEMFGQTGDQSAELAKCN